MTDTTTVAPITGTHDQHGTPEEPVSPPSAPPTDAAARRARVEELQRRRAESRTPRPTQTPSGSGRARRWFTTGAAQGSKVAAAGFGFAAMLGMVGAMGYASRASASSSNPALTAPAPPAPVVVVIHPAGGTDPTTTAAATPGLAPASPSPPIVLNAQPTARQAPASPAPTGQTNGSR